MGWVNLPVCCRPSRRSPQAPPALPLGSSSEGPDDGHSSSTSEINIHIDCLLAKREKEPLLPADSKADYNRALPRLPVPETPLCSGASYDNANANNKISSVLGLQERDQAPQGDPPRV